MHDPLPRSSPAANAVDSVGVLAFLDAVERTKEVELHSLMILRHGAVIVAGWWAPYSPDGLHLLHSLSKSFTSTALGMALGEGLLGLDDKVISFFPELEPEIDDPRVRGLRIRHLAAMSSGHRFDTWDQVLATDPEHPVRAFLHLQPTDDPGTVFAYNQSCLYTLAVILQRVTGGTLTRYLRTRVLDAIGAEDIAWAQRPAGQDQGFTGLHATTDTIARLGQLYLDDGCWQGKRVLPAGWVAEATRVQSVTAGVGDAAVADRADWKLGYGFQFWRSRYGYRADGAFGQYSLILPELDAVIATTGQSTDAQALLDLVWTHLVPAFGEEPIIDDVADRLLEQKLAGLSLTPSDGDSEPADREAWSGLVLSPAQTVGFPSIDSVTIHGQSPSWRVSLAIDDERLDLAVGRQWELASSAGSTWPLYSSGGWRSDDLLVVDAIFVETPHRLVISCSLSSRTFTAEWIATPRRPAPLTTFRAPFTRG